MGKTTAERVKEHRKRLKEQNEEKWKQEKETDKKKKAYKRAALKKNPKKYNIPATQVLFDAGVVPLCKSNIPQGYF